MNREQKRLMQKQGQLGTEGTSARRTTSAQDLQRRRAERTHTGQFVREVREEMRQVAWPKRPEVINYTSIVFGVLVFMTALIFGLGAGFSRFVTFFFQR